MIQSYIVKDGLNLRGFLFFPPHPHRHFTYGEFEEAIKDNYEFFIKDILKFDSLESLINHNCNNDFSGDNKEKGQLRNIMFFGNGLNEKKSKKKNKK